MSSSLLYYHGRLASVTIQDKNMEVGGSGAGKGVAPRQSACLAFEGH